MEKGREDRPAEAVFPYREFTGCFSEFADESAWPQSAVMRAGDAAMMHIGPEVGGMPLHGRRRVYALFLMAAHILALRKQNADSAASSGSGQPTGGGIVYKATVGGVTVESTKPNSFTSDDWTYWLSTTPYGQELLAMLETVCPFGIYLNGRPESVRVLA